MISGILPSFIISGCFGALSYLLVKPLTVLVFKKKYSSIRYYALVLCMVITLLPIRLKSEALTHHKSDEAHTAVIEFSDSDVNQKTVPSDDRQSNDESKSTFFSSDTVSKLFSRAMKYAGTFSTPYAIIVLLIFASQLLQYIRYCTRLLKSAVKLDKDCCGFLQKGIGVYKSGIVTSPILIHVPKPVILLPDTPISDNELNTVMLHEGCHIKHRDFAVKVIMLIVKCVHFYNPAIYLIARDIEKECEICCDMKAVSGLNENERKNYIKCVLSLADGAVSSREFIFGLNGAKKELERRFNMILNNNESSVRKKAILAAVCYGIAICTLLAGGVFAGNVLNEDKKEEPVKANAPIKDSEEISQDSTNYSDESEASSFQAPMASFTPVISQDNSGDVSYTSDDGSTPKLIAVTITEPFANPEISYGYGDKHNGIDYKAEKGTEIKCGIDGFITNSGYDSEKGNYVEVKSNKGEVSLKYCHLDSIYVKTNDSVKAGDIIGTVGNTGMSTGPHLHFEVEVCEKNINPELLFSGNEEYN